jgi:hypothetical protein
MSRSIPLPSPALVVALIALFVALSGGAAAGTALVSRQAASHSSGSAPASLVRRVAALEKKVTALQKQSNQTEGTVGFLTFWNACAVVTTADALQGTWQTIDDLSAATQGGKTYFGPQTPIDDRILGHHACVVSRVGRMYPWPRSIGYFNNLLNVFR